MVFINNSKNKKILIILIEKNKNRKKLIEKTSWAL